MRLTVLALTLVVLVAGVAVAGPAEDRRAYRTLLGQAEFRHGVHHRSLVVVPLVLRVGVEPPAAPGFRREGLRLEPVGDPATTDTVRLTLAEGGAILPAGLLLAHGGRERILSRPVLLEPGGPADVRARFCDAHAKGEDAPTEGPTRVGALAPLEQRRADLLFADAEALADVQRIQAILAGLGEDARYVEEVMRAPAIAEHVAAASAALSRLPGAYDGAVVGHLALLGHRPVELILSPSPESYRSVAPDHFRALAVTVTLWEEFLGMTELPIPPPDWTKVLPAAGKVLGPMGDESVRLFRWGLGRREKGGGRTLLLLGRAPAADRDDSSRLAGRLLMGADGRCLLLEAYPSGANRVFPPPLTEVGGRSTDSRPGIRGGAMTNEFLDRFLERYRARRAKYGR